MRIVFLGSGAFGVGALEAVRGSRHEVVQVISQPDRPAGRGKHLTPTPVSEFALAQGLALTRTEDVNSGEMLAALRMVAPDALVVIAFGQKLSDELLAIPRLGAINLHSSLLPKYRGAAPINWTIIHGDKVAGVSVIEVTKVMDGGDIFAAAATPVGDAETAGELHDRLAALGAPLVVRVLDELAEGRAQRITQDKAAASRAPKLRRELAWVDFGRPAEEVAARMRGMAPWPGVQVEMTPAAAVGKPAVHATVLKCRAVGTEEHAGDEVGMVLGNKTVMCGRGCLEILTLQPAGKKAMDLRSFANGHGFGPGTRVRSVIAPPGK